MFNRRALVLCAILAVLIVLIINRSPAAKTAPPAVVRTANTEAPARKPAREKKSQAAALAAEVEPPKTEDQLQQECWGRFETDYPATTGFISYARPDLEKIVGPWFFDKSIKPRITENSPASEKFLYALARAGFLFGGPDFERNDEEAYSILFDLAFEDRDNSAPLLYLAALEQRKPGADPAFFQSFLKSALQRPQFNTYRKDIHRAMMKHVRTPNDYMAAADALSRFPEPEVTVFKKVINDSMYAPLALQMMSDGLQPKKVIDGLDYVSWEYTIGWHILNKLGMAENFPSWSEVRKDEPANGKCHPGLLDQYVAIAQKATASL